MQPESAELSWGERGMSPLGEVGQNWKVQAEVMAIPGSDGPGCGLCSRSAQLSMGRRDARAAVICFDLQLTKWPHPVPQHMKLSRIGSRRDIGLWVNWKQMRVLSKSYRDSSQLPLWTCLPHCYSGHLPLGSKEMTAAARKIRTYQTSDDSINTAEWVEGRAKAVWCSPLGKPQRKLEVQMGATAHLFSSVG